MITGSAEGVAVHQPDRLDLAGSHLQLSVGLSELQCGPLETVQLHTNKAIIFLYLINQLQHCSTVATTRSFISTKLSAC